jgi:hypothetical protein
MVRDFYLRDMILTVVFDPLNDEYRMILSSGCTSICVTMKCKCLHKPFSLLHHTHKKCSASILLRGFRPR